MNADVNGNADEQSNIFARYFKWFRIAFVVSLALPLITSICTFTVLGGGLLADMGIWRFIGIPISLLYLIWYLSRRLGKISGWLASHARFQDEFFDGFSVKHAAIGIAVTACLSLLVELILIRWQACLFEFFSFYKNFTLLACFCGLGTGYAIANKKTIPILFTPILLAWQILILMLVKYGLGGLMSMSLKAIPVTEAWFMGLTKAGTANYVATYSLLCETFMLSALCLLPVGQLCGRLMSRLNPLPSYGLNLGGSLAGVILMMALTAWWTPPGIWFAVAFILCLACLSYNRAAAIALSLCALIAVSALDWPVDFGAQKIYSPYQLLELEPGTRGVNALRAAGTYYQRMLDLSKESQQAWSDTGWRGQYYELPFRAAKHLDSVAIIGAGTGNDVAAALRAGAQDVQAIEIDPAIQALGAMYHPELPYSDKRVHVVINDGRAFLRNTKDKFDAIVFGLVDSHTLSSQATSLRLDSYIYTVDALKEARSRLKDGGVLSLAFCVPAVEVAKKIHAMMTEAFDGHQPVCLIGSYDDSIVFMQNKEGSLPPPPPGVTFKDASSGISAVKAAVDVSTDDWPFFYMVKRQFPASYMFMVFVVLLLSAAFIRSFNQERPRASEFVFFLLGAGFMLLETKAITELGLHLGNTFFVISVVIAAIMFMAFLANLLIQLTKMQSMLVPYILLIASLIVSWQFAGVSLPGMGAPVSATIILTFPIVFSGMVFSLLIKRTNNIGAAMGMNIFGAMCGGLIEYCAMFTGYRMLYVAAIAIYGLAFALTYLPSLSKAQPALSKAE